MENEADERGEQESSAQTRAHDMQQKCALISIGEFVASSVYSCSVSMQLSDAFIFVASGERATRTRSTALHQIYGVPLATHRRVCVSKTVKNCDNRW